MTPRTRSPADLLTAGRALTIARVADGAEGLIVADLARAIAARPKAPATSLLVVCRDGPRMAQLSRALEFFAPDIERQEFPAWDCQPYDRVSPHAGVVAQRMTTLSRLARLKGTREAVDRAHDRQCGAAARAGEILVGRAGALGRTGQHAAHGRHRALARSQRLRARIDRARARRLCRARRHPRPVSAGTDQPVRLDFFGDSLESIRSIDPETQRSTDQLRGIDLVPVAEFQLTTETIKKFPPGYVEAFGAPSTGTRSMKPSAKAAAIPAWSTGCRCFTASSTRCSTTVAGTPVVLEPLVDDAAHERLAADRRLLRGAAPAARTWGAARLIIRCSRRGSICRKRMAVDGATPVRWCG